jgi:hypothetical protein
MKIVRFAGLALVASLVAMPAMAQDSPVVGVWNTQAVTDFGTFASTVTVIEDEGGYLVTIEDAPAEGMPAMEGTVSDVVVDGATFSFKRNLAGPQGPMVLAYTGNVDGDALTATVASDFGNIPVTGTRAD